MTTEHEHDWAVSQHAGFGCRVCDASYWDWSRAELFAQTEKLTAAKSLSDRLWRDVEGLQGERTELLARISKLTADVEELTQIRDSHIRRNPRGEHTLAEWACAPVIEAARLAIAEFRGEPVDELGLTVRLTRLGRALDRAPSESVQ